MGGDVLGEHFVLRGPNQFLKWLICHVSDITWLSRVIQMGPLLDCTKSIHFQAVIICI